MIKKLKTPEVNIRGVKIGGENPIVIQSMTSTDTADVDATVKQIIELADAGSEIVRIAVNTNFAAEAVPEIRKKLDKKGYKNLPLIGDFHFNGPILLKEFPKCAESLDKYRINPGNIGKGNKHNYNFKDIIKIAIKNNKAVRIGVNWGSLDQDLLTKLMDANRKKKNPKTEKEIIIKTIVDSALISAKLAEKIGLPQNKIILSVKMSDVQDVILAHELLAEKMKKNKHFYALHLGITEAGLGLQGVISNSCALAILLKKGIGDTIRTSMSFTKEEKRSKEVEICKQLLQSMGLRYFVPQIISCPGCGRTDIEFFQKLLKEIKENIFKKLPQWKKKHPKIIKMKIAIMGCVVNGPGESKYADIGISLPGKTEKPIAPIYIKGKFFRTLTGKNLSKQFIEILERFIEKEY